MTLQNEGTIVSKLLEIEDDLELFNHKIDGVYFWERIRFQVYIMIKLKSGLIGQIHTTIEPTIFTRSKQIFSSFKNIIFKNPYFSPRKNILFLGSPRRKLGLDQKWHDIYCDPIIEHLNDNYIYLEKPYLGQHLSPPATEHIYYLDFSLFIAAVLRKCKMVNVKLSYSEIDLIMKIKRKIDTVFNLNLDVINIVKDALLSRKSQLPFYKRLLKRVRPSLIIVVCSYGKETFIEAGKSLGITVVELQHGLIDSRHLGYSFPGSKRFKKSFPDYLLTFGDLWCSATEYPINADRVISVGYPYLEKEMQNYNKNKQKDQLVFISQGTVGAEMSKVAVELSEKENFPYKIIYKLHPGEYARWRKEYPWLINSKVIVIDGDHYPLYKIFAESKVQIGVLSTAIFEGIAFGLKTILLPLSEDVERIFYLLDNKTAVIAESTEKIIEEVNKLDKVSNYDISRIFKKNAIDNINRAIEGLINTGKTFSPK